MFKPVDLFDLSQTGHAAIFEGCTHAWEALKQIKAYVEANVKPALHNRCERVAFIGERVFIGSSDGRLYGLDRKTGRTRWSYEAGGGFTGSPAVAGGYLVVANDDGVVYCFGAK